MCALCAVCDYRQECPAGAWTVVSRFENSSALPDPRLFKVTLLARPWGDATAGAVRDPELAGSGLSGGQDERDALTLCVPKKVSAAYFGD